MKIHLARLILVLAICAPALVRSQAPEPEFDVRKIQMLRARQQQGEKLTQEELDYLQRAIEWRRKRAEVFRKENPVRESTGLVPLPDLGMNPYKGHEGGLYTGGTNTPPEQHLEAGLKRARDIVPRDSQGAPSNDGRIVLLSIGMSNTTQEFQVFQETVKAEPKLNPRLVIVDGAQGGQSAEVTADRGARFWQVVGRRLGDARVTPAQVQVVWMKQAIQLPSRPFPAEARKLQQDLATNLQILAEQFPNLKIAYLSSRTYGGFAETPLNPEPHAYESGFSVRWVIADQIAGNAELNYEPKKGTVRAPWVAWGPYLWSDGTKGRRDGFAYSRDDFADDGTHPSNSGRQKVAKLLLDFLKKDPTARPWFVRNR